MNTRHLVFDLDGTLVESLPGIAMAVNLALQSLDRAPHTAQAIRAMIGRGASDLCAKALGFTCSQEVEPCLQQAMEQAFAREYAHTLDGNGTTVFEGITDMLQQLAAVGAKLAVLSNKPQTPTKQIVERLFKGIPFSPIMGFEKGRFPRKPDPTALQYIAQEWGIPPTELTLVGDSIHDAHTAHNAGSKLCLVSWGYSQATNLRQWQEEHSCPLLKSVEELSLELLGKA